MILNYWGKYLKVYQLRGSYSVEIINIITKHSILPNYCVIGILSETFMLRNSVMVALLFVYILLLR